MKRWIAVGVTLPVMLVGTLAQGQTTSLSGVIDFHVHSGPDSRPRSVSDLEVARIAKRAGMRGLVFKNHFTMTADRAWLAMQEVSGIEIFGGVALNHAVGGLNAEAVRQLVAFSGGRGKVVWLPTFDAEFWMTRAGDPGQFVPVMRDGRPDPALGEIFDLIAQHELVLAMGHSSPEEVLALIPEARRRGVRQILVTHGLGQQPSSRQLAAMVEQDAIIELVWLAVGNGEFTLTDYADAIREHGARHFLLSSDLGQEMSPLHTDGLVAFMEGLRAEGISDEEIDLMIRRNPVRLLGLDP
jgi:microsomal dipeptidase-like Zn-dependent dipeptidase